MLGREFPRQKIKNKPFFRHSKYRISVGEGVPQAKNQKLDFFGHSKYRIYICQYSFDIG
jgi:hypothetical protein